MLNFIQRQAGDWWSGHWFAPDTLWGYSWAHGYDLYFLLLVPVIFLMRRLLNWRIRQKVQVALFPHQLKGSSAHYWRHIPMVLWLFSFVCIIIAAARPQRIQVQLEQTSQGIDILIVMDVSESMLLEDFTPNRLEAAKTVARTFINGRRYDRIGLVVFSGEAYSLTPLTTDYALLEGSISEITGDLIPQGGTAIGSALGIATNRLLESQSKSKVIILISDGDNTAGSIEPTTSAKLAAYYGIKIYTILVGNEGEIPYTDRKSGTKKYAKNTIDETILKTIASIGEGKYFRTFNNNTLQEVFTKIDSYEKSDIKETSHTQTIDYYHIYLTWGIIFLLLRLLLKSTFLSNVLED
jgi:Ca-activated chloride channel family protein